MKMRAPETCQSFDHSDVTFQVADDGSVDVPDCAQDTLIAHGFRPWSQADDTDVPVEAMNRSQLITHVVEMTVEALKAMSTEDIRLRLLSVRENAVALPDERAAAGVSVNHEAVVVDDIAAMNRPELFAFLRAKGISTALPISNDTLRRLARNAANPSTDEAAKT